MVDKVDVKTQAPQFFYLIQQGTVSQSDPVFTVTAGLIKQHALEIPVSALHSGTYRPAAMLAQQLRGFCGPERPPHACTVDDLTTESSPLPLQFYF